MIVNTVRLFSVLILVSFLIPANASADMDKIQLNLTSTTGYASFPKSFEVGGGLAQSGRIGVTLYDYVSLEGSYGKVYGSGDRVPGRNFPLDQYGADLMWNILPEAKWRPFLVLGWAQLDLDEPNQQKLQMNGWEYGAGVKVNVMKRTEYDVDLRLGLLNVTNRIDAPLVDAGENKSSFFLTAGVQVNLPSADGDEDGDGVRDSADRCPGTRLDVPVTATGCPEDSDEDGIPDGVDLCRATPYGAMVDDRGCPTDTDGDGVLDGLDQCPDTSSGKIVNAVGCFKKRTLGEQTNLTEEPK